MPQEFLAVKRYGACEVFSRLFESELIPQQKVRALAFHALHFPLERGTLRFDPLPLGETCICADSKPSWNPTEAPNKEKKNIENDERVTGHLSPLIENI